MNQLHKKKLTKSILFSILFLSFILIFFSSFVYADNEPEQTSNDIFEFLKYFYFIFIIFIIFFVYIFITRYLRKKRNQTYEYGQTEPEIFKNHQQHIKQTKTKKQKTYTCAYCKYKATKKDCNWYQSKKTKRIICEPCYIQQKNIQKNQES